ncbi:MAG TPA: hypothetical protein VFE32_17490 [Puia sp.]|jgi:hypothetical protein|nr:hypothetical protein [Puia sp.]
MLLYLVVGAAGFIVGALVAWNNTKASLKAKLDAEIKAATAAGAQTLAAFKAKL